VAGFRKLTERVEQDPESVMPWMVLGRKWHLVRKGFPPGKKIAWPPEVLEELLEMISSVAPKAQMLWNNSQVINILVPQQREPWARIWTKKPAAIEMTLTGPKGDFAMGRIAELGVEPDFDARGAETDVVKLRFISEDDLHRGDLEQFLQEHLQAVGAQTQDRPLFRQAQLAAGD
jgi:excinuclease ABC subunit A